MESLEKEKVKEVIEKELKSLCSQQSWVSYLESQLLLLNYSFNNVMLLKSQNPLVSKVMSFKKWKEIGATVNKGEKALRVYAPICAKKKKDDSKDTDKPKTDKEEKESEFIGKFVLVPVFDVSQVSGYKKEENHTEIKDSQLIERLMNITDIPIINIEGSNRFNPVSLDIEIAETDFSSTTEYLKELIYRYSEYQSFKYNKEEDFKPSKLINQSVCYLIFNYFKIMGEETFDFSEIKEDDSFKDLKNVGTTIQKIAFNLIPEMEKSL